MTSLDQLVAPPPLSALLSIMLLVACARIGSTVLSWSGFFTDTNRKWLRWQTPVVGVAVLTAFLYPLALLGLAPLWLMRAVAAVCAAWGGIHLATRARTSRGQRRRSFLAFMTHWKSVGYPAALLAILAVGQWLMALAPVTDADSLDYHIGIPIALLRTGSMPVVPEWFSGRLAGSGEVINALGLAIGAEQFGSLLQVAGLMAVAGLMLFAESDSGRQPDSQPSELGVFATMAALSAPVCVMLVSPKPQLMPVAMTTLALALLIFPSRRHLSRREALSGHALVCLLVMSASQQKLTYMLGGGVVGLTSMMIMARRKLLGQAAAIAVGILVVVMLPSLLWKVINYQATFIDALMRPLPGPWPGTEAFEAVMLHYRDGPGVFPVSLVIPPSLGYLSAAIGPGLVILFGLRPGRDPWLWTGIGLAVTVGGMAAAFGPLVSRQFLETYFWLLVVLALQRASSSSRAEVGRRMVVVAQAALTAAMFWYGVATLLPGALAPAWRDQVMDKHAQGYSLMKWADRVLPRESVLLNGHRSMAFMPRKGMSLFWTDTVPLDSAEARTYLLLARAMHATHMLYVGDMQNLGGFQRCVAKVHAGPFDARRIFRNPFNKANFQQAWILAVDSALMPGCATGISPPSRD